MLIGLFDMQHARQPSRRPERAGSATLRSGVAIRVKRGTFATIVTSLLCALRVGHVRAICLHTNALGIVFLSTFSHRIFQTNLFIA
jgi:hypothetical protein